MFMNGQRLFAGMIRDLTTRKRAEIADAKSLFVANMVPFHSNSHRFNTSNSSSFLNNFN